MFEEKHTFTCKNQPKKKKKKTRKTKKPKLLTLIRDSVLFFGFGFAFHLVFRQKPNILKSQYLCVYVYNIYIYVCIYIYMCVCVYGTPPPRNYCPNLLKKNFKHIFPEIGKCVYIRGTPLARIYWRKREKRIPQNMQKSTVNISKSSKKVGFWGTHIYIYLLVIPWWLSSC